MPTPTAKLDLNEKETFVLLAFITLAEATMELNEKKAEQMIDMLENLAENSESDMTSFLEKIRLLKMSFGIDLGKVAVQ